MRQRLLRSDMGRILTVGLFAQGLTVLSGPLLARMLGPTGRGEVVTVLAVGIICTMLSTTSLGKGISRTVARRGAPARDVVGPFLPLWLAGCLVPATLAAVGVAVALRDSQHLPMLVAEAFTLTLLGSVIGMFRGMVLGENNIRRVNLADGTLVAAYVATVAVLFLVSRTSTPSVVLLCQLAGQVLALVLLVTALAPARGVAADPTTRAEVHRFARRAYFGSVGTLDRLGFDMILIGQVLGNAALGLYAVASSISTLPAVLVGTLAGALLPKMSALKPEAAAQLMRRWVFAALALAGGMMLALQLLLEPLLRIFFGEDFVPATTCARLLLVANTAFAIRLLLASGAQAQGREASASWVSLVGGVGLLLSLLAGAQLGGLDGAALGVLLAAVANSVALALTVSWTGRDIETHTKVVPTP